MHLLTRSIWDSYARVDILDSLEFMASKLSIWGHRKARLFKDEINKCKLDMERLRTSDRPEDDLDLKQV